MNSYTNILLYKDAQMGHITLHLRPRSEVEVRTSRTKHSTPKQLRCKAVE